jgi:hypothetical protein
VEVDTEGVQSAISMVTAVASMIKGMNEGQPEMETLLKRRETA